MVTPLLEVSLNVICNHGNPPSRGFFEREGRELDYQVTEERTGKSRHYVCKVELPIDTTESVYAEGKPCSFLVFLVLMTNRIPKGWILYLLTIISSWWGEREQLETLHVCMTGF